MSILMDRIYNGFHKHMEKGGSALSFGQRQTVVPVLMCPSDPIGPKLHTFWGPQGFSGNLVLSAGPKRVEIHADREVGAPDPVMGIVPREAYVPDRYSSSNSILRAEVEPGGENRFHFELDEGG